MGDASLLRLTYEIVGENFTIHDTITGGVIIYKNGNFESYTLDKETVVRNVRLLIESLHTCTVKKSHRSPEILGSCYDAMAIRTDGPFKWSISYGMCAGTVASSVLRITHKFDVQRVLGALNKLVYVLTTADQILTPRVDIVRRIPDAKLVVWVWKENSTVCYEDSIKGCTMSNCLINGIYYDVVLVSANSDAKTCTLFTTNLDPIVEYPLDDSITFFYHDVKEELK